MSADQSFTSTSVPASADTISRRLYIQSHEVPTDPHDHDLLYYRASTFDPSNVSDYKTWFSRDRDTGQYLGPKPLYQLLLDWSENEDLGQVGVVNKALERCFGTRGSKHWSIFIKGDRTLTIIKELRAEYVRAVRAKLDVQLLDVWVRDLLMAFRAKMAEAVETPSRGRLAGVVNPGSSGLGIPTIRRSSRSPSPTMRNMDQHPDYRAEPFIARGQRPSDGKGTEMSDAELNRFLDSLPTPTGSTPPTARNDAQSSRGSGVCNPVSSRAEPLATTPRMSKGTDQTPKQKTPVGTGGTSKGKKAQPSGSLENDVRVFRDHTEEEDFSLVDSPMSDVHTPTPGSRSNKRPVKHSAGSKKARKTLADISASTASEAPDDNEDKCSDEDEDAEESEEDKNTILAYFKHPPTTIMPPKSKGPKATASYEYRCLHCPGKGTIKFGVNSNLHAHQLRCPGLMKAIRNNKPGVTAATLLAKQKEGTKLDPATLQLVHKFTHEGLRDLINKLIISLALPFSTVESADFRKLLMYCNAAAKIHSRNTVRSDLRKLYCKIKEDVDAKLKDVKSVIHYCHDAWTDAEKRNSYFGLVACYVDSAFKYQEVLVRFLHMAGTHSGERIGNGLWEVFEEIGISDRVGPGTGDNASNNISAANFLATRLNEEAGNPVEACHLVGCVCHVANLAARDFLDAESLLDIEDYSANPDFDVPQIRVIGVDSTWSHVDKLVEEEPSEVAEAELPGAREGLLDGAKVEPPKGKKRNPDAPVVMVHRLAIFILASAGRRADFEAVRLLKNPTSQKRVLLKDVPTRWNSTYFAIRRAIDLKETVIAYTSQYFNEHCPRFTRDTFKALEELVPTLDEFMRLTTLYSESAPNSYRVLTDIHLTLAKLRSEGDKAVKARKRSFQRSHDKLEKYMRRYLDNDWICAAFALNPRMRERGLSELFKTYDLEYRTAEVVDWIKQRADAHTVAASDVPEAVKEVAPARQESPSPFEQAEEEDDEPNVGVHCWEEYNSNNAQQKGLTRHAQETVLQYWKRQSKNNVKLRPLAKVARDVLGLAPSSTLVERVFSTAGHVLGDHRGSLSPAAMVQHVALKNWDLAGLLEKAMRD